MAKKQEQPAPANPIQKVGNAGGGALTASRPDFMTGQAVVGTETLKEFVILPRLKIVQKQAATELLTQFGTGDLILSPTQVLLAEMSRSDGRNPDKEGPPLYFTPLYFFPDWATWNPIERKGQMPVIEYRTNNPNDPIVAKSRDKNLRMEPLTENGQPAVHNGKPLYRRHVEHLNWIIILHGHEGMTDPFIVSFAKGEHFSGRAFAGLVRMRKTSPFGCVFEAHSTYRPPRNAGNDWYGIDVRNPAEGAPFGPWVTDKARFDEYQAFHTEFESVYKTQGIQADLSEPDDVVDSEEVVDTSQRTM